MRKFLEWKERIHVVYVKIGYEIKKVATAFAPSLFPSDPADVFYASGLDLLEHLGGTLSKSDFVERARATKIAREMWAQYKAPYWAGVEVSTLQAQSPSGSSDSDSDQRDQLHGLACSSGSGPVRGRVRVVEDLKDAHTIERGDILVTRLTAPGWTPVFSLISALVLEEGGMLSHGSVLAREFGLAAVVSVDRALTVLVTGDEVIVDGESGLVIRCE